MDTHIRTKAETNKNKSTNNKTKKIVRKPPVQTYFQKKEIKTQQESYFERRKKNLGK